MRIITILTAVILILTLSGCSEYQPYTSEEVTNNHIEDLINLHAQAWIDGDAAMLDAVLHEDVIFAYPGRRLNKQQTIEDLEYFAKNFRDTKVYINKIIIDGNDLAVEWQFATTKISTGERQVVSDAIIGKVKDGKFVVWKEYLDGRVKLLQASGELHYEEGLEPFPWPLKTQLYQKK